VFYLLQYASLTVNIFKLVPRDGRAKLLVSLELEQNSLERKFGGGNGFMAFTKKKNFITLKTLTRPES